MKHLNLKWIAIIIAIIIILIKLFVPPLWTWTIPESIRESKRTGAFLWEYEISRIDTLEPNYNFPKFKNIWMTKDEVIKRNKFGIIHLVVDKSSKNHIVFDIKKNDESNLGYTWIWSDNTESVLGEDTNVLLGGNYTYTRMDTVRYTIYKMKEPHSIAAENLIPIFRMELVSKPD